MKTMNQEAVVAMTAVFVVLTIAAFGADWPQYRGINRDGKSTETNWLAQWPPVELWRTAITPGFSSPVVSEGRLYTMGLAGYGSSYTTNGANVIYCLDANTGAEIWKYSYAWTNVSGDSWISVTWSLGGPKATPTVCGNELYTFDDGGVLCCFDKVTGSNIWSKNITARPSLYGLSSSPLVQGNLIILNAGGQGVAVDRNPPHDIVWPVVANTNLPGHSSAMPVTLDGQEAIVMSSRSCMQSVAGDLLAVNAVNGQIMWTLAGAADGQNAEDVILYQDKIYYNGQGGYLLQPGTNSATVVWSKKRQVGYRNVCTPVVVGDYVYHLDANTSDLYLECFDIRDGSSMWSTKLERVNSGNAGQLIAADGKLLVIGNSKMMLLKATPTGYDDEGRGPVLIASIPQEMKQWGSNAWWPYYSYTYPAFADGRIYYRFFDQVVCYQVSATNVVPVAWDDVAVTRKDTPVTINVLANDSDANSADVLAISAVTQPSHGVAGNGGTNVTYTPTEGYTGADSFTYTITDSHGGFATGKVSMVVANSGSGLAGAESATTTNGWERVTVHFSATGAGGSASLTNAITDGTGRIAAEWLWYPTELSGMAFDKDTNTYWLGWMGPDNWIEYSYTNGLKKRALGYSITSGWYSKGYIYYYPIQWTLLGSNDRRTWTALDSQSSQAFTAGQQKRVFSVANPGSYSTYRLQFLQANYGYVYLYELELLENGYSYNWSFGDGSTSTAQNPFHTYTNVGNYQAQVVITDSLGGTVTNTVQISVKAFPELEISMINTESSVVGISFDSIESFPYKVYWKSSLTDSADWQLYTSFVSTGGVSHVTFTNNVDRAFIQIRMTR